MLIVSTTEQGFQLPMFLITTMLRDKLILWYSCLTPELACFRFLIQIILMLYSCTNLFIFDLVLRFNYEQI